MPDPSGTWDQPDFADPRFKVNHTEPVRRCLIPDCGKAADWYVDYSMRREPWTYDYEGGYCDEHLPVEARKRLEDKHAKDDC